MYLLSYLTDLLENQLIDNIYFSVIFIIHFKLHH